MTLYQTVSSSAGLGYGLGGQSTTAHSTSGIQPESSAAWAYQRALQAAQMQAQQAMLQAQTQFGSTAPSMAQAQAEMTIAQAANQAYQQAMQGVQNATVASTGLLNWANFTQPPPSPELIKKSTDAVIRSMELLYDWLNPDQRKQLATRGFFTVIGGKTKIHYRIYEPANYNIHELDKDTGETLVKLCFQPTDKTLPKGDIWLCQKLALELDEENTLALANRSANYQY